MRPKDDSLAWGPVAIGIPFRPMSVRASRDYECKDDQHDEDAEQHLEPREYHAEDESRH